jgi:hypothetical protein
LAKLSEKKGNIGVFFKRMILLLSKKIRQNKLLSSHARSEIEDIERNDII